ncbi:glycine betaine ABC transporter substrate-binding protein [Chromatiaceae bacterium AAb-1]|nr:glycine betaine ABC transporter substrate-binding protein [Chromatiaceae bacterium AAb-1]
MVNKFVIASLLATILLSGTLASADSRSQSGEAKDLVIGQINLSFYLASAAVVVEVLNTLGHSIQVEEGNHPTIYGKLNKAEVDILIASWLPHAHGHLHAPVAEQVVEATVLYEDARLYWVVPAHIPASVVSSIDDLKKPEVRAKMDPDIVGVGPGSGLMLGSEKILHQYGLTQSGYSLRVAPADEWASRLARASANGTWMVMPLWQPQYLNAVYPVRVLDEPQGIFGKDRAVVVVRKQSWNQLPERTRQVLSKVRLGIMAVTELERQIVVEGKAPQQAARDWMTANQHLVKAWFED